MRYSTKKRLKIISSGFASNLAGPLVTLIISFLVINLYSTELWGRYVQILIITQFINAIASWGNRQYLIKQFANEPNIISKMWTQSVFTRSVFLIFSIPIAHYLSHSFEIQIIIVIWITGMFLLKAFDPLIIYYRTFVFSVIVELCSLVIFLVLFYLMQNKLDLFTLILLVNIQIIFKILVYTVRFRKIIFKDFSFKADFKIFKNSFPFFSLEFTGMLGSRIDLYCVAFFLPEKELGTYQVIVSLVLYFQAFSGLIIQPYLKNIYRAGENLMHSITKNYIRLGIIVATLSVIMIYFLGKFVYHLEVNIIISVIAGLLVFPVFAYSPKIYTALKNDIGMKVVYLNVFSIVTNLLLNILLIQIWGITGALFASALTHWLLFILYYRKKPLPGIDP